MLPPFSSVRCCIWGCLARDGRAGRWRGSLDRAEHHLPPRYGGSPRGGHCALVVARGKGRSPSREVVGGNTIALIEGLLRGVWDLMTESAKGRPSGGTNSRLPRGGRLLGPLLGLVFLIYPVRAVLTSDATPARVAFALGGAALFAGVFLWLVWEQTPPRATGRFDVRGHRVMVAFLVVLAISLNLILGSEWLVLFFHVNIAAGMLLLAGEAYVAIAGLAAVTFA